MHLLQSTLAALSEPNTKPNLATCMQSYDTANSTFYHDFFTITLDEHPEFNGLIKKILDKFSVPLDQQDRYLNQKLTIYAFLVELNGLVNSTDLTDCIDILSNRKNARWKNIALGSLVGGLVGITPFFMFGLTVFQQVLSIGTIISCGGLIYSVAVAAYTAYEAKVSSMSFYQLFRDNFFTFAKNALTISAWSILLIAAVTTPVASILFVVADAALVIKESVNLAYIYLYKNPRINPESSLAEQHIQARELTDFEKRKYAAWVNVVAAIVMTGIIAAWCFVPGGIFLIAGALLAIGGVYFTTNYLIQQNEKKMETVLKERFEQIESASRPNVEPSCQVSPDASNNAKMQATLNAPAAMQEARKTASQALTQDNPASYQGLLENSLFHQAHAPSEPSDQHHTPRSPP